MPMITDPQDFFTKGCGRCARFATPDCSTRRWIDGLNRLREICRSEGLTEEVKWAHPCYTHAGRNIALIGAFRGDFRLSFMNAGLLTDAGGLLVPNGPNSRLPSVLRLDDVGQVAEFEAAIRRFLRELMAHAEAGTRPPREERELELPEELVDALDADPEMAEAFAALTPGRQRSHVFALNTARQPATRLARVEKLRPLILAGKGALER
jgi:uncharacterized protein YdeI (YjbR/CyaY-like superfamily)